MCKNGQTQGPEWLRQCPNCDLRSAYNLVRIRDGWWVEDRLHNTYWRDMMGQWAFVYLAQQLLEKCVFHQCSTTFLGFVITPQGVAMEPQKLEAVCNWLQSKTFKPLQQFLGFTNFYRRLIRDFSSVAAHFTNLDYISTYQTNGGDLSSSVPTHFYSM